MKRRILDLPRSYKIADTALSVMLLLYVPTALMALILMAVKMIVVMFSGGESNE